MPHLCSVSGLTESFLSLLASVYLSAICNCVCGGGPVWLMEREPVCVFRILYSLSALHRPRPQQSVYTPDPHPAVAALRSSTWLSRIPQRQVRQNRTLTTNSAGHQPMRLVERRP